MITYIDRLLEDGWTYWTTDDLERWASNIIIKSNIEIVSDSFIENSFAIVWKLKISDSVSLIAPNLLLVSDEIEVWNNATCNVDKLLSLWLLYMREDSIFIGLSITSILWYVICWELSSILAPMLKDIKNYVSICNWSKCFMQSLTSSWNIYLEDNVIAIFPSLLLVHDTVSIGKESVMIVPKLTSLWTLKLHEKSSMDAHKLKLITQDLFAWIKTKLSCDMLESISWEIFLRKGSKFVLPSLESVWSITVYKWAKLTAHKLYHVSWSTNLYSSDRLVTNCSIWIK